MHFEWNNLVKSKLDPEINRKKTISSICKDLRSFLKIFHPDKIHKNCAKIGGEYINLVTNLRNELNCSNAKTESAEYSPKS